MDRQPEGSAPRSVLRVRLLVGGVLLAEGILEFLLPAELGAGRFAKIRLRHRSRPPAA
jgi:putative oxidoreductase